jgi:hypothetical protein
LPRYRHQEMAADDCYQSIWVEPRERALAPVGEGFLFKDCEKIIAWSIKKLAQAFYPKEDNDGRKI